MRSACTHTYDELLSSVYQKTSKLFKYKLLIVFPVFVLVVYGLLTVPENLPARFARVRTLSS